MTLFDASTWIGSWPFAFLEAHTPRSLVSHLRRHGIGRALVSPLDGVFAPEPGPANRALLRATRSFPGLLPVPLINPTLANWPDELAACAADARVRVVRVLPSYHRVPLGGAGMRRLVAELEARGLRLALQVRLIDERHEYHGLSLKPVALAALTRFLASFPDTPVLVSGLLRSEVAKLAPSHPRMLVDLSYAEWLDTVRTLLVSARPEQLVFASHAPFLVTAAATAKLDAARLPSPRRELIAHRNLDRFLSP